MKKHIGIDIGGTKIRMGIMDEKANMIAIQTIPMRDIPAKRIIDQTCDAVEEMLEKVNISMDEINGLGIGIPGTVDSVTGTIEYCPNIAWSGVPVKEYFNKRWDKRACVAQDSRLAALGEALYGAGRGYGNIACITIGTGIGCGIIMNGEIFDGGMNTAGELGHITVEPGGRSCACGNKGCLEQYCSGTGILRGARARFPHKLEENARTEDVFELAYRGDVEALLLISDCVDILARGVGTLINLISPETVILSGGLCVHERLIIEPLRERVFLYGYPAWTGQKKLVVKKAELGEYAPMIGAAAFGLKYSEKDERRV